MKVSTEMTYPIINNPVKKIVVTAVSLFVMASHPLSFAAGSNNGAFFGKKAAGKWIIGGKVAKIDLNTPDVDDVDAAGIVVGYEFASSIGDLGGTSTVELEYISGDEDIASIGTNLDVDVANLFFTYRSAGTVYYKLKGGLSYASFDVNTFGVDSEFEDTSASFGVGLGYRIGDLGVVEVEYSADTGDSDLGVIGVNALLEF